jgi:hypothetical protein
MRGKWHARQMGASGGGVAFLGNQFACKGKALAAARPAAKAGISLDRAAGAGARGFPYVTFTNRITRTHDHPTESP